MNRHKNREQQVLEALTAAAANGRMQVSPVDLKVLTDAILKTEVRKRYFPRHPNSPLNTRELQILAGLARGHSNAQIAKTTGLSPFTVKSHLTRISKRIGCGDRAGMVGLGYRKGWLAQLPAEHRALDPVKPHQLAVLDGMAHGLSHGAIAQRLFISEDTVKSRARAVFIALGASNRAHAVALAYQHGLLTIPTQHDRSAAA